MDDDRATIVALVHAYAERLDAGDLDGVADLFTDATWRTPAGNTVRGRDAVRRVYDPVILYDGTPRTKHLVTNLTIDVDEAAGTATARSYYTVLQALPDLPLQPIISGRYHDAFARTDGRWHFTDRLIHVDLTGDLSRHYPGLR